MSPARVYPADNGIPLPDRDYEEDKYRVEGDVRRDERRAEYDVDRFGDGIERRWEDGKQDIEDAPGDVAGFMGRRVGGAERFGDDMRGDYDQGRNEERYGRDDGGYGRDDGNNDNY